VVAGREAHRVGRAAGIRVVQPDGGGLGVLVPLTGEVWEVSWSPEGKRIAFVGDVVGPLQEELWVANADGTGVKRLNVDSDTSVSWGDRGMISRCASAATT
jgi:Tol biopolymer transport system component